jgi:hypothetical protein
LYDTSILAASSFARPVSPFSLFSELYPYTIHSLVDKVYKRKNLELVWEKVRQNRGAGGIDGQSIEEFEQALDEKLDRLHDELKNGDCSNFGSDSRAPHWDRKNRPERCFSPHLGGVEGRNPGVTPHRPQFQPIIEQSRRTTPVVRNRFGRR